MSEKITDRCRRICGDNRNKCFIKNGNQVECIADMIVNKATVSLLGLEQIQNRERLSEESSGNLKLSIRAINELVNWVKFLQITHDLKDLISISYPGDSDHRTEIRYPLPRICQKYITTYLNMGGILKQVILINFSQSGLQIQSSKPVEEGSVLDCLMSTSHPIRKKVEMKIKVMYCAPVNDNYIVGGRIEEMSDNANFNFFMDVYDFIKETECCEDE